MRLALRIGFAVLLAIVIAEAKALLSGGNTLWTFRIMLFLLGGFMLLLAGAGTGSAASRRVNWGTITPAGGRFFWRGFQPKPEDRTLTPAAVFIGSGIVLLALGAVL
jgi:hypothetical protein